MNGPLVGSVTSPYWIYLVYGMGAIGLYLIGKKKWYGWAIMAPVRISTAVTAYLTNTAWAVLGSVTFLVVDVYNMYDWRKRQKQELEAAHRFVDMVSRQFAEGKKAAIDELVQISRDVDELSGRLPGREDALLKEYVRREQQRLDDQEHVMRERQDREREDNLP